MAVFLLAPRVKAVIPVYHWTLSCTLVRQGIIHCTCSSVLSIYAWVRILVKNLEVPWRVHKGIKGITVWCGCLLVTYSLMRIFWLFPYRSVNMNGIVPTASPSNSMHFWQPMKSYWKTGCVKKVVLNFITELYESRINQSINLLLIIVCLFCFNMCSEVDKAVKANPDNSYSANIRNYQLVLLGGGWGSQTKEWWCSSV